MTTHQHLSALRPSTHRSRRLAVVAIAASAVTLLGVPGTASAAPAPLHRVPAKGTPITCRGLGTLVGASGYLLEREDVTTDHGHAHALFTITTENVRLVGPHGQTYRFEGTGYDDVDYPTKADTGDVRREDETFVFDVLSGARVVGRLRFQMHTGPDQIPHIHTRGACQFPQQ